MDKLSKKIMKFMRTRGENTNFTCSLSESWNYSCDCSLQELIQEICDSESNILSAIEWLADEGWLEYESLLDRGKEIAIGFHLSHKGLHQKEETWSRAKEYIMDKWIDFLALAVALIALLRTF